MDLNTFANKDSFKMLEFIHEKMDFLLKKEKSRILSFLTKINLICKKLSEIDDKELLNLILPILRKEFIQKNNSRKDKIDPILLSYIQNFIFAKFKILQNDKNN